MKMSSAKITYLYTEIIRNKKLKVLYNGILFSNKNELLNTCYDGWTSNA